MSWFPRSIGTVIAVVIALALIVPLLCQLVAILFVPIVVLALLVMAGRVIWWYTQS